jgi:hypothetical protein
MPLAHGYKNLAIVPLCSVPHLSSFCALHRTTPSAQPPTQTGLTHCLSVLVGKVAVPAIPLYARRPCYYKNLTITIVALSVAPFYTFLLHTRCVHFYSCTQRLVETCVSHI